MSNVKIAVRVFLHESINLKALLKESFNNESSFVNFRTRTAKNNLVNLKQVKAARTGYLSL